MGMAFSSGASRPLQGQGSAISHALQRHRATAASESGCSLDEVRKNLDGGKYKSDKSDDYNNRYRLASH